MVSGAVLVADTETAIVLGAGRRHAVEPNTLRPMHRRLGEYSISLDVGDAEARGGVVRRKALCAHRSTVNSLAAETIFGALVCTGIGRGGAAEQQLWPI
ncbi:MAG: hypothetical protein QOI03_1321 [Solirubrobacteraceae bacterium]|nr:hypothetical protein [Solirubrobacteraceae bacterium]